jgi:hypothetical protein
LKAINVHRQNGTMQVFNSRRRFYAVNCEEFYDLVSERIDNRLTIEQAREFAEHAKKCHPCDMEYLFAAIAKAVVREKVRRIPVPSDVYLSIINSTIGSSSSSFGIMGK